MKRHLGTAAIGIVCFALGIVAARVYDRRHRVTPARAPVSTPATVEGAPAAPPEVTATDVAHELLWAYGFDRPPLPGETAAPQAPPTRNLRADEDAGEQTRARQLDGSTATYSLVDIRDGQHVIDWFPADHPPMPFVVAHGPARLGRVTRGCGSCHLPNGKGRPENASLAGLPIAYFVRQIQDFRAGLRRTADPRKPNTNTMIDLAKAMTDDELMAAAQYFSSIRWTPWLRVVETNRVPKTRISGNLFLPIARERTEPIAGRIIEVPQDVEQAETYRNPHSGFLAYVPVGAVVRGEKLVLMGGATVAGERIVQGKTTACTACHGLDLMGVADVPPIAGRSPSYLVRQLWDLQQGTRRGASAQLMKLVVANLTPDDMVDIAAYVASRAPAPSSPAARTAALMH